MRHPLLAVVIGATVVAGAGVGIGLAVTAGGGSPSTGRMMGSASATGSMGSYYQAMMATYGAESMMGGSQGSPANNPSYAWMMGGTSAPGWMLGGALPESMMGSSSDTGMVMGKLFADAPGERVSPSQALRLGNMHPARSTVDRGDDSITFEGASAHLVVLASPASGPDETFRIAGLVNPTISVKAGTRVTIEVVNADSDAANGLVIAAKGSASSRLPMLTARSSFSGSALWFLGDRTVAGMHVGMLSFTASAPGTYQYLCPVPEHAKEGMVGGFQVTS